MTRRPGGRRALVGTLAAVVGMLGLLPASASAEADTTPPVLRSVALGASSATPGVDVPVLLDFSDDVGVVRGVVSVYQDSSGTYQHARFEGTADGLAFHVDPTWGDSTYRLANVWLYDAAGNMATYGRTGAYRSQPPSPTKRHDVPFDTTGFVVSGGVDVTPPVLESIDLASAPATRAGQDVEVRWSVTDARSAVAHLDAGWTNEATGGFTFGILEENPPPTGSTVIRMPTGGPWVLSHVRVVDAAGVQATYTREGHRVLFDGSAVEGTHDIDFTALDMSVAPAAPAVTVLERPGRLTLVLDPPARPEIVTGYRVSLPSGATVTGPVADVPLRSIDVPNLPNGALQSLSVTLQSPWGESPVAKASGRPVLSRNVTGTADVTGDRRPDLLAVRQAGVGQDPVVIAYPGTGAGGVRNGAAFIPSHFGPRCDSIGAVDVVTSAGAELLCRADTLSAVRRDTSGILLGSRGWSSMRWADGGFDLNGDARSDVLAVNSVGDLVLYRQTTQGKLLAPMLVSRGWQSMISVVSAGDLTGDRRNDVVAVDAAGRLWLYPGTGTGTLGARRQLATGWHTMGALLPLRDFDGDGKADLGGITMDGRLLVYRGTGTGAIRPGVVIAQGWQVFL